MTRREMENKIRQLEENVSILAGKTHEGYSQNASDISSVSTEVDQQSIEIDSKASNASVSSIWNDTTTYIADTFVLYENQLYKCLIDNFGVNPSTDTVHWELTNIVDELNTLILTMKGATV